MSDLDRQIAADPRHPASSAMREVERLTTALKDAERENERLQSRIVSLTAYLVEAERRLAQGAEEKVVRSPDWDLPGGH